MKHVLATTCILTGAMLAGGCATKKYVRNTTAPIQAKVDQVGEQTTKQGQDIQENRNQIKTVDESAKSGISAAQERASTADSHAQEAMNRATQVDQKVDQTNQRVGQIGQDVSSLRDRVANLDDYKLADEVVVPFGFNKWTLTTKAKEDLDTFASKNQNTKRFFIAVEGYTDKTGSTAYNQELSRKRAEAVVNYLVAKHNIPVYRIHEIGLGKEKPAEEGRGRAARAKNRRVEVKLFSADQTVASSQGAASSQPAQTTQR